jgi:hypothetical protein
MKVYVDGQTYPTLEFDITQTKSYIYTNDGIYLYKESKSKEKKSELHKIEIENENEIREKEYNNYHFFIDSALNSKKENIKNERNEILYHIPYDHLFCQEEICKKNIGDGIFLVKVNYFDQVDYYFETDRTDESLYDVIITFLSSI